MKSILSFKQNFVESCCSKVRQFFEETTAGIKGMSRSRYVEAAEKYAPSKTRLLFIAEAPPASCERYFYFPEVRQHDDLWLALMKALYGRDFGDTSVERQRKAYWLNKFRDDGYRLIDIVKEPIGEISKSSRAKLIRSRTHELVTEIREISPGSILLIKVTVYDELHDFLKKEGLPVVDARLPFPGSGRQADFQASFERLLTEGRIRLG